jgi:hypothetical protein
MVSPTSQYSPPDWMLAMCPPSSGESLCARRVIATAIFSACAKSVAFYTVSTLSSNVEKMVMAASVMISGLGWLGTSRIKQ